MCVWELYLYLFVLVALKCVPGLLGAHSEGIYRNQPPIVTSLLSQMPKKQDRLSPEG